MSVLDDVNYDTTTCGNCRFWRSDEPATGRCHRHAPDVIAGAFAAQWPTTASSDWCGDHER